MAGDVPLAPKSRVRGPRLGVGRTPARLGGASSINASSRRGDSDPRARGRARPTVPGVAAGLRFTGPESGLDARIALDSSVTTRLATDGLLRWPMPMVGPMASAISRMTVLSALARCSASCRFRRLRLDGERLGLLARLGFLDFAVGESLCPSAGSVKPNAASSASPILSGFPVGADCIVTSFSLVDTETRDTRPAPGAAICGNGATADDLAAGWRGLVLEGTLPGIVSSSCSRMLRAVGFREIERVRRIPEAVSSMEPLAATTSDGFLASLLRFCLIRAGRMTCCKISEISSSSTCSFAVSSMTASGAGGASFSCGRGDATGACIVCTTTSTCGGGVSGVEFSDSLSAAFNESSEMVRLGSRDSCESDLEMSYTFALRLSFRLYTRTRTKAKQPPTQQKAMPNDPITAIDAAVMVGPCTIAAGSAR
jgi:hypothetical protein